MLFYGDLFHLYTIVQRGVPGYLGTAEAHGRMHGKQLTGVVCFTAWSDALLVPAVLASVKSLT